ncbi:DUF4149 domain-containing protein [Pseudomonas sp. JL972]|uniref:DUF4149 domain-containing protein n=1 Tax=Stutzerimonas stutzeri group TaxID=136846 RepID=UPI00157F464C|nr:DUF4149 domain-containing protein [Stutzerimonas stutzeri]MCF6751106.1 DUF4149 domain-containing protein [Stutzerimonas stutzeri]MTZ15606.1 DUF4149 domain-containing protein [Stutzerimonas degradans]UVO17382.1 DUF4149 domain-containing protein [Stutzerimonas stutzeri]
MRGGTITWQLAQTFWVGGLWLLHFVVLPALAKVGLAPLLVDELAAALRPLLVGFAGFCVVLQAVVLLPLTGLARFAAELRGQLLLATLLLAISFFIERSGVFASNYWSLFSYLAMAFCGLLLVLQPPPGREG